MLLHNVPLLLKESMGEVYARVVKKCLSRDFGSGIGGDELDKAFWKEVVRKLDGCEA